MVDCVHSFWVNAPFQLHLVMLFSSSATCSLFERLTENSLGFGLALPEQDEAFFVVFLSAGLGANGSNAMQDVTEIGHELRDSHCSCLID